jgi:hypothetical protein
MKLLEVLNLDEENADKFLLKYNSFEKQFDENRKAHHRISKELSKAIKSTTEQNNATPNAELLKKFKLQADSMLTLQEEFNKLTQEKMKAMKTVLSDWQYVKYVDFENNFMKKLFNSFVVDGKHTKRNSDGEKSIKPKMTIPDRESKQGN